MEIDESELISKNTRLQKMVDECMVRHDAELLLERLKEWMNFDVYNPELIELICCNIYGITVEQFRSKRRFRKIVDARKMFAYYFRIEKDVILRLIGGYLRKTHDSIIFLVREYEGLLAIDQITRDKYYTFLLEVESFKEYT